MATAHRAVVYYRLPGYDGRPAADWVDISQAAARVARLVQETGLARVDLIGHSTGAVIATIMSGNVFLVIIPNQKIVVEDLKAGRAPDPKYGQIAKLRSTHNNYLTLPVIAMMVSNHYPIAFGHPHSWVLIGFILGRMLEDNFARAMQLSDGIGFILDRPMTLGLLIIAALLVLLPSYRARRARLRQAGVADGD